MTSYLRDIKSIGAKNPKEYAFDVASKIHDNIFRLNGNPYIRHPTNVHNKVLNMVDNKNPFSNFILEAAYLHDVAEDAKLSGGNDKLRNELKENNFFSPQRYNLEQLLRIFEDRNIVNMVGLLTKISDRKMKKCVLVEPNQRYLIKSNRILGKFEQGGEHVLDKKVDDNQRYGAGLIYLSDLDDNCDRGVLDKKLAKKKYDKSISSRKSLLRPKQLKLIEFKEKLDYRNISFDEFYNLSQKLVLTRAIRNSERVLDISPKIYTHILENKGNDTKFINFDKLENFMKETKEKANENKNFISNELNNF